MILRPLATTAGGYKLPRIFLFYPIDTLKVRAILSKVRYDFIFHLYPIKSSIFPSSHKWYKVNAIMVMHTNVVFTSLYAFHYL